MRHPLPLLALCLSLLWNAPAWGNDVPARFGLATLAGTTKAPEKIGINILQVFALYDYENFAGHPAPENLRLRLEGNLGITNDGHDKSFASVNALGLYYLGRFGKSWRPYGEAGVGIIYSDFRLRGQDYYLNFNPQVGAGLEFTFNNGSALQLGCRFHHISNASLGAHNRGVDSMLIMLGWHF
ncbi:MAG: acyloxyacyl hydrolase [Desulfuromonas sp.]|nr:MAG: acyloxyacyl hydrolase [Desulfuromonas sp.]